MTRYLQPLSDGPVPLDLCRTDHYRFRVQRTNPASSAPHPRGCIDRLQRHGLTIHRELFADFVGENGDVVAQHMHLRIVRQLDPVQRVWRCLQHAGQALPIDA